MRVLLWHVHGSWTTAFVQGRHEYLVPVLAGRGPYGRGRAQTWTWPDSVHEKTPQQLRDEPIDVVILQRPHELRLLSEWTGRRAAVDLPAVYVEHDAPEPYPVGSRHLLADRDDIRLVHVTHFNQLYWESGRAPTTVIEHGIPDPGDRYTGEVPHAAVVVNEPLRRGRTVGTDLLRSFAEAAPLDLFGMPGDGSHNADRLGGVTLLGDVPQAAMHRALAIRRVYLHPYRWTSLGLSLIEAMMLGLPVVGVAATAAVEAVPPGAGVLSADVEVLRAALREFVADRESARMAGRVGRTFALRRFGLDRFLAEWDHVLSEVTGQALPQPIGGASRADRDGL